MIINVTGYECLSSVITQRPWGYELYVCMKDLSTNNEYNEVISLKTGIENEEEMSLLVTSILPSIVPVEDTDGQ
jgi:hypothetical protein